MPWAAMVSERRDGKVEILAFLEQCRESGDNAYAAFKAVLTRLQNEDTRREARAFLGSLEEYVEVQLQGVDCLLTYHFRIHQLTLTDYEGPSSHLCLLLLVNSLLYVKLCLLARCLGTFPLWMPVSNVSFV